MKDKRLQNTNFILALSGRAADRLKYWLGGLQRLDGGWLTGSEGGWPTGSEGGWPTSLKYCQLKGWLGGLQSW